MKNFIKNNIFISFAIALMWIFLLCLSIAEKGFFTEHLMEAVGTTISFIGIGTVIKTNRDKIEKRRENRKEINKEEIEKKDKNEKNNKKSNKFNFGNLTLKKYISVLLGIATIFTVIIFWIYKTKFTVILFFVSIFFCFICEIAICGTIGIIVQVSMDYVKDCKEKGFLKATILLILLLIFVAFVVYNKDAKLFQK